MYYLIFESQDDFNQIDDCTLVDAYLLAKTGMTTGKYSRCFLCRTCGNIDGRHTVTVL